MLRFYRIILNVLLTLVPFIAIRSQVERMPFAVIGLSDGLSNNQINCIFHDRQGFIWFGTPSGLDRYDGFRFKNYFYNPDNPSSLPDNSIERIMEDKDGCLWIKTTPAWCRYNPLKDSFDHGVEDWLSQHGIDNSPDEIFIDRQKNIYVMVNGKGCYWISAADDSQTLIQVGTGKDMIPYGEVSDFADEDGQVIMVYNDGTLVKLDGKNQRVVKVDRHIPESSSLSSMEYGIYIDKHRLCWIYNTITTVLYDAQHDRWYDDERQWMREAGYQPLPFKIVIKDMGEDSDGRIWIATDHQGVLMLDPKDHTLHQHTNVRNIPGTLPDNTVQSLMIDANNALWVGTYKNGIAYNWMGMSLFQLWDIGDVCSITKDEATGNYWCGTNDAGIVCYNPTTRQTQRFTMSETHLQSDVVVSSLAAKDGTLWFGTFNGGLTHYHEGVWTTYLQGKSGLANNSIWSIDEDSEGNILVGTLGGGLQILNVGTGEFKTYNTFNSTISSDYIASVQTGREGQIYLGHSGGFSVFDVTTERFTNYRSTKDGKPFLNLNTNQMLVDHQGLCWIASLSGVNIYDMRSDSLYVLTPGWGHGSFVAASMVEDADGNIWIATDRGIIRVKTDSSGKRLDFDIKLYPTQNGFLHRQFNFRSIFMDSQNNLYVGSQEGVNVLHKDTKDPVKAPAEVLFSGLSIFDKYIEVEESYNGEVLLHHQLNDVRELSLGHEDNSFTVMLGTSNPVPAFPCRFMYRLKGVTDKWQTTAPGVGEITYSNLPPGNYTLQVQVVDRDGDKMGEVAEMKIRICPPFYQTTWAYLLYVLLIVLVVYFINSLLLRRQKVKMQMEQIRHNAQQERELEQMKMRFFTNASHELRTPLSLVVSPLQQLAKDETDERKRSKLNLILRNADKLLQLVNEMLDFRRLDMGKEKLNLVNGDIVQFVKSICTTFSELQQKKIQLTFHSQVEGLMMSFDDDKMGKIFNNLLNNAYKFTPEGGKVAVYITMGKGDGTDLLVVDVADTGVGVADSEKKHIFDRFYQVRDNNMASGGSGIGLNLTKSFVEMHGGGISVSDSEGGGARFTIHLPVRHDESLRIIDTSLNYASPILMEEGEKNETNDNQIAQDGQQGVKGEYEVLIVDDSQDFLDFMSEVMAETYRVRMAHDGKEALQMVAQARPDIILSDVMMPEMDGVELCRKIKQNPSTRTIPFVMLTARITTEQKIEGMEVGADDYITKPFNLDILAHRMSNLIGWSKGMPKPKIMPKASEVEITSLDEKLVQNATELVEKNMENADFSVEILSQELGMSRVNLYKKLLSITGKTPSEFIRMLRLQRGEQLLRQSQMSVSEIAYKVGFNNPRYFSKYFKEEYGEMPSDYKAKHGK
ncbi:MAG: response regulator [Bacteroidaceae bacterium]|nr:response regulator [Bacteroidaceae bacterium]